MRGSPSPHFLPRLRRAACEAFTLIELLVVIGLMVALMAILGPAMNGLKTGSDFTTAAYDIAGIFEQARTHAIAFHTYTWVGIGEFDASKDAAEVPQLSGTGRVAIVAVASRDGTRGYDVNNSELPTPAWTNTAASLTPIMAVRTFENLHLAGVGVLNGSGAPGKTGDANTFGSFSVGSGGMLRPFVDETTSQPIILRGGANTGCVTPYSWPLTAGGSASAKYTFSTVVNFDPQGVARIQTKGNLDGMTRFIEAGLQPTQGTVVLNSTANVAAVQINCMSGRSRIYRP